MIHSALYKLIFMQFRGFARRALRGGKSPGRALVLLIGAVVCVGWLVLSGMANAQHRTKPEDVRAILPLALLGICFVTAITSAGDKAIAFTPGEVDQLFPGPFSRRELLAYKLIKSTLAAILTAAILSILLLKHARWWPACYVGVFLSLLFVQFFTITLLLFGQAMGTAAYTRLRKFIMIAGGVLIILGLRAWMVTGATGGARAAMEQFRNSQAGRIVLAPFEPFGQMMTSNSAPELLKWAGLAALLNIGLVALVMLLDAYYLETAIAASERRYAKIQRVRAGAFLSIGTGKTANWHLPAFPFAGGAGPIAWRQLTNAARSSRGLFLLLLMVAIGTAPVLANAKPGGNIMQLLAPVVGTLTFLCATMFTFDFRGDIDYMDSLKALPLRSWAVVGGELVTPVLVLSSLHVLLLGIAATLSAASRKWLVAGLVVVVPANAIIFGLENLIFLLFPTRPAAVSPGDFQAMGSRFVFLIARVVVLMVVAVFAGVAGRLTWQLSGKNLTAGAIATAIILTLEAIAMLPVIAWAYRRFDPSIHTPA